MDRNSQEVRGNMSYKSKTLKAREGVFTPLSLSPSKGESSSACNPMDYLVAAANQILTTTETKASNTTSSKKNSEIWFTLVASDDQYVFRYVLHGLRYLLNNVWLCMLSISHVSLTYAVILAGKQVVHHCHKFLKLI